MGLELVRSQCNNGRVCPGINRTGWGSVIVQGYIVPAHIASECGAQPGETVVEVPVSLLPEVTTSTGRLHLTDRDTILVVGSQVTDEGALTELSLPAGEDAVELAASEVPELVMVMLT